MIIVFSRGDLTVAEQSAVSEGFSEHSKHVAAPEYEKERIKWTVKEEKSGLLGVLTADALWDWLYIDELWISPEIREAGLGKRLMKKAEEYATSENLKGIWLWTQSWQAEGFYKKLGYTEFTRFEDFPRGHCRIGLRKVLDHAGANESATWAGE